MSNVITAQEWVEQFVTHIKIRCKLKSYFYGLKFFFVQLEARLHLTIISPKSVWLPTSLAINRVRMIILFLVRLAAIQQQRDQSSKGAAKSACTRSYKKKQHIIEKQTSFIGKFFSKMSLLPPTSDTRYRSFRDIPCLYVTKKYFSVSDLFSFSA